MYNESELLAGKNEITKLASDKKKQFVSLNCINFTGSVKLASETYFYLPN